MAKIDLKPGYMFPFNFGCLLFNKTLEIGKQTDFISIPLCADCFNLENEFDSLNVWGTFERKSSFHVKLWLESKHVRHFIAIPLSNLFLRCSLVI